MAAHQGNADLRVMLCGRMQLRAGRRKTTRRGENLRQPWGISSAGRALQWHCKGRGFDFRILHQITQDWQCYRMEEGCVLWTIFVLPAPSDLAGNARATCRKGRSVLAVEPGVLVPTDQLLR
jgi:hypothetical protein